jgi:hypothetical protein
MVNSTGNVLIDSSADLPLEIQIRSKLNSWNTYHTFPVEFKKLCFKKNRNTPDDPYVSTARKNIRKEGSRQ